jgi:hypothetical protein
MDRTVTFYNADRDPVFYYNPDDLLDESDDSDGWFENDELP